MPPWRLGLLLAPQTHREGADVRETYGARSGHVLGGWGGKKQAGGTAPLEGGAIRETLSLVGSWLGWGTVAESPACPLPTGSPTVQDSSLRSAAISCGISFSRLSCSSWAVPTPGAGGKAPSFHLTLMPRLVRAQLSFSGHGVRGGEGISRIGTICRIQDLRKKASR